jgi:hypothetical protein
MANALAVKTRNGLVGDGEDRRDRVDGEDDVGDLDEHQHRQQGRGEQDAAAADEEALAVVGVGHRHEPPEQLQGPRPRGSTCSSRCRSIRQPVTSRNAAKSRAPTRSSR